MYVYSEFVYIWVLLTQKLILYFGWNGCLHIYETMTMLFKWTVWYDNIKYSIYKSAHRILGVRRLLATYFFLNICSFLLREVLVVLVHTGFAVAADQEHEHNHGG